VFWVPLFQILEQRGFEVCLVNAHHVKNVPGRKTDVSDCQWLQYLHSVGLLQSFVSASTAGLRAPFPAATPLLNRLQIRTRDLCRDSLAVLGFPMTYKPVGNT
jgi:hypothetical protein